MKRIIGLLILGFALAACQGGSGGGANGSLPSGPAPKQQASDPPLSGHGGTDSAGGNGVKGRVLEAYKIDLRETDLFKAKILPIIGAVTKVYPRLGSDLYHIARERRWYFIPGELAKIPSERIGVAFETDQLALQNLGEVWVNQLLFDKMKSDDDRAVLILHEIVMGVRLMRYQDSRDECLSGIARQSVFPERDVKYQDLRDDCFRRNILAVKDATGGLSQIKLSSGDEGDWRKIKMNEYDYIEIRDLVDLLWSNRGNVSEAELVSWVRGHKFRDYDRK